MENQNLAVITEQDYFDAMARIARNEHTDDDLNLVRAWEARMEEQRNKTIEAIRNAVSELEGTTNEHAR